MSKAHRGTSSEWPIQFSAWARLDSQMNGQRIEGQKLEGGALVWSAAD